MIIVLILRLFGSLYKQVRVSFVFGTVFLPWGALLKINPKSVFFFLSIFKLTFFSECYIIVIYHVYDLSM